VAGRRQDSVTADAASAIKGSNMLRSAKLTLMPVVASALATSAGAGTRQKSTVIMSENPASRQNQEQWGYADAVRAGDTIYVSGVVAALRSDETDYDAAYTRAFEEIGSRLRRLGSSWDDVVEIMSFHTDLVSQMPAIVAAKKRYVRPPYPAWTAVGVTRLIPPSGITEIRVTAVRQANPSSKRAN
jgi:enamine deaminase RidA (YjgF/YER057c/UK114 family)